MIHDFLTAIRIYQPSRPLEDWRTKQTLQIGASNNQSNLLFCAPNYNDTFDPPQIQRISEGQHPPASDEHWLIERSSAPHASTFPVHPPCHVHITDSHRSTAGEWTSTVFQSLANSDEPTVGWRATVATVTHIEKGFRPNAERYLNINPHPPAKSKGQ